MFSQNFPTVFLADGAQLGRNATLPMKSISRKPQSERTAEEYRFIASTQALSDSAKIL